VASEARKPGRSHPITLLFYNFHLICIAAFEARANAPRPVDRDRPLASSVALELRFTA
jgi:hypothetical protein